VAKTNPDQALSSEPDKVDEYVRALVHPLKAEVEALRAIILSADKTHIGEHIKWNHPAFFYIGAMKPFNPKEYKRYIIVSNLHSKEGGVLLVFPSGAKINDTSGLLSGDYTDGRRLVRFYNMDQVNAGKKALIKVIKTWLSLVE
jgi:hypothetical protein